MNTQISKNEMTRMANESREFDFRAWKYRWKTRIVSVTTKPRWLSTDKFLYLIYTALKVTDYIPSISVQFRKNKKVG